MSGVWIFILLNVVISKSTSRRLILQTGASVTIPCAYDKKYIHHKKYWCYDANAAYSLCTIQAYANNTQGKVTVTDYPSENLFTVTMEDLQTGNTGSYWCAVEIPGIIYDVTEQLYITVQADPDLYVMESRVSVEEGGSVTVQCLYSAGYQETPKQWCRLRDRSCYSEWRTDDRNSSFNVKIIVVKKSDADWYWCKAGDLEIPVHISVRDPPPVVTTAASTTAHPDTTHTWVSKHNAAASLTTVSNGDKTTVTVESRIHWYLVAFLLQIMILIVVFSLLRRKCRVKNRLRTRERSRDAAVHTHGAALDVGRDAIQYQADSEGTYSSIIKSNKKKPEERRLEQVRLHCTENECTAAGCEVECYESSALKQDEEDVIYSSVKIVARNKSASPNAVEADVIYSSIV